MLTSSTASSIRHQRWLSGARLPWSTTLLRREPSWVSLGPWPSSSSPRAFASTPSLPVQSTRRCSRLLDQPSEVAPSFVFLASKDSELYYGQVLHAYPHGD